MLNVYYVTLKQEWSVWWFILFCSKTLVCNVRVDDPQYTDAHLTHLHIYTIADTSAISWQSCLISITSQAGQYLILSFSLLNNFYEHIPSYFNHPPKTQSFLVIQQFATIFIQSGEVFMISCAKCTSSVAYGYKHKSINTKYATLFELCIPVFKKII